MKSALKTAIERAGGQVQLGQAIGVSQQRISYWLRKHMVPAEYCLPIEAATGVSRHDLRPDLWPAPQEAA